MTHDVGRRLLRAAEPAQALAALQKQVAADPGNAGKRVFLFQLLSVIGQWQRAATQLEVPAGFDAGTLAAVAMYREALRCDADRARLRDCHDCDCRDDAQQARAGDNLTVVVIDA